jgi:hypothetical protein
LIGAATDDGRRELPDVSDADVSEANVSDANVSDANVSDANVSRDVRTDVTDRARALRARIILRCRDRALARVAAGETV